MSDHIDQARVINAQFVADVEAGSGSPEYEKTAAELGGFLRDKKRENGFTDRVIPLVPIGRDKLRPGLTHDTPVYLDFMEPDAQAVALTFRGRPDVRWVSAERYEIPFFTIASLEYEKAIQELIVYPFPIMQVIERNVVRDMDGIKDYYFMTYVEDCVADGATLSGSTGQYTAGRIVRGEEAIAAFDAAGGFDDTRGELQRADLIELGKIFSRTRRDAECLLLCKPDQDNIAKWTLEDLGSQKQGEVAFGGVGGQKRLSIGSDSVRTVVTIKVDIVQEGNIYMFTAPEYLGKNFLLHKMEFWAEKKRNLIRFGGWYDCGMSIGNKASVAKLELYNSDASDALPAEATIGGGVYNDIAGDKVFPHVVST